jgi:hypothetical protein
MEDVTRCPRCHSDEVLPIAYGVPTPKMVEESKVGRMTLGGRVAWPGAPDWRCVVCGHEWRDDEAES